MKFNLKNPLREKDLQRRNRSSNILRNKQNSSLVINTRLLIIIIILIAIFLAFAWRLFSLQVLENDEYTVKLEAFTTSEQTISPPRGNIYDSSGKPLAQSAKSLTIMYYPTKTITDDEEWKLAKKFVDEIGVNKLDITKRQLKDMYIAYELSVNNNDLNNLLTEDELDAYNSGKLSSDDVYNLKLKKINPDEINEDKQKLFQVKMRMDASPTNELKNIESDCSNQQLSYLKEHGESFPGFIANFGWKRVYTDNEAYSTIVGKISSKTQGIPAEKSQYYKASGYALNDQVGISGIEKQYEQYLAGSKATYEIAYNDQGEAYMSTVSEGKNGYNLTLTLNCDYQAKVDEVIKSYMESAEGNAYRQYWDSTYFVAVDIKTGGIIAMDGVKRSKDGKLYSDPTVTYLEADRVGSCVKIATLYMGENEGVVKEGEVIVDAPMTFSGSEAIHSYHNYGPINDIKAIAVSSNVYMWNIALRLGGSTYVPNGPLYIQKGTIEKMRSYYNMFGLGVKTGIDMPDEAIGSIGAGSEYINALYIAIGQYDTYTPMQLAQYATTIANNGNRLQLHLLDQVTENQNNSVIYKFKPNILSTLLGDKSLLERGQIGMSQVVSSGFAEGMSNSSMGVTVAGKTGTAENEIYIDGQQILTTNSTMVSYAPYENPEVAFICFTPNNNNGFGGNLQSNSASAITGALIKEYFANYRK